MDQMNRCNPYSQQPASQVLAMAYVPEQKFSQTYDPQKALKAGTIFPELNKPFTGKCKGGAL